MRNRIREGFQLADGRSEFGIGLLESALDALTIGDVANGAGNEHAFFGLDWAKADLDWKFSAIPAQTK